MHITPPKFEAPSFEQLVEEQQPIQAGKFQSRVLEMYNDRIFQGMRFDPPRGTEVEDFLDPLCDGDLSLEGLLLGMHKAAGRTVNWTDMGGGRGLAMRQLATYPGYTDRVSMTSVDLFDCGLEGLKPHELTFLEELAPGMMSDEHKPKLVIGNAETVKLETQPDVVTAIESIQYMSQPLEAIASWYNQSADDGLVIIATEHEWSKHLIFRHVPGKGWHKESPAEHLLKALTEARIPHAATNYVDSERGNRQELDPKEFRNLAIQKLPGTRLEVLNGVAEIEIDRSKYKWVSYEIPEPGALCIAAVKSGLAANTAGNDGAADSQRVIDGQEVRS